MIPMRYARIVNARKDTGVSRSKLYVLDKKYKGLLVKFEGMTFCDMPLLDKVIASEGAKTGPNPRNRKAAA